MIKDPYANKSLTEMKALHSLYMAFIEYPNMRIDVKTGETPNCQVITEIIKRTYGTYSWDYHQETTTFTIKDDWFNTVFLEGIPTVFYNGKLNAVLDVKPLDVSKLRKDLQLPDIKLYSCLLPIITQSQWQYDYHTRKHTKIEGSVKVEQRFITAMQLGEDNVIANAGLSPNRAGANLKKRMMEEMKKKMGV